MPCWNDFSCSFDRATIRYNLTESKGRWLVEQRKAEN